MTTAVLALQRSSCTRTSVRRLPKYTKRAEKHFQLGQPGQGVLALGMHQSCARQGQRGNNIAQQPLQTSELRGHLPAEEIKKGAGATGYRQVKGTLTRPSCELWLERGDASVKSIECRGSSAPRMLWHWLQCQPRNLTSRSHLADIKTCTWRELPFLCPASLATCMPENTDAMFAEMNAKDSVGQLSSALQKRHLGLKSKDWSGGPEAKATESVCYRSGFLQVSWKRQIAHKASYKTQNTREDAGQQ